MPLLVRDLACKQAVELVTDYLDGALRGRARRRFERHLRGCPNCTAYLEQIRATVAAMGRVEPEELDPRAREELTALFRRFQQDREG
jgi:anti-sigma factor RsiW